MKKEIKIPSHVGIIMDGNGRWAKKRGKQRSYGHRAGSDNVDRIATHAFSVGVKALTLYAFSSENWTRPKEEVDELMRLLKVFFKKYISKLIKNEIKLVVIGDLSALDAEARKLIETGMEKSKGFKDKTLNVAVNYGGRQEIVKAVKELTEKGEEITVDGILEHLYTAESGEPDLIIRTGGEYRLSNFLLYQGAYSELYFTDVLWPDFDEKEFDKAIENFSKRERRFGAVKP